MEISKFLEKFNLDISENQIEELVFEFLESLNENVNAKSEIIRQARIFPKAIFDILVRTNDEACIIEIISPRFTDPHEAKIIEKKINIISKSAKFLERTDEKEIPIIERAVITSFADWNLIDIKSMQIIDSFNIEQLSNRHIQERLIQYIFFGRVFIEDSIKEEYVNQIEEQDCTLKLILTMQVRSFVNQILMMHFDKITEKKIQKIKENIELLTVGFTEDMKKEFLGYLKLSLEIRKRFEPAKWIKWGKIIIKIAVEALGIIL